MRRLPLFVLAAATSLLLATPLYAQNKPHPEDKVHPPEGIEIGMSTDEIAITSDFTGANLTVFGTLTNTDNFLQQIGQYDIVVALEGPRMQATVRRKTDVFGIWVNTDQLTFSDVPQSYSMTSTRQVSEIASPEQLDRFNIGIHHVRLFATGYLGDISGLDSFREAFLRRMQESDLYQSNPGGIRFVSPSLFKATLRLPANVPNGVHMVHAFLFKSGKFVMETKLPLRVVKTGIEQSLTDAAYNNAFFYGIASVLIAALTGWAGSVIFRKD